MKKILLFLLLPIASFAQVQFGGPQDLFLTGASALTATVNNILPDGATSANGTDMSGYGSALVQVVSTGTGGTFIFEGSNSIAANFQAIPVWNQATPTGTPITAAITATSSQIGYWVPKKFRYIRLRIATTITGGSIQAISTFTRTDTDPNYFQVANATAANLQATVTATNLSTNVAQIGATTVVNGGVAGTLAVGGNVAHSAASTANPLQAGGRVVPTTIATVDQTLLAGEVGYKPLTTGNQAITKDFGTSELDWSTDFSQAVTTTGSNIVWPQSGTAGVRTYITSITMSTDAIGAAGVMWLTDGNITSTSIAITTGLTTTSTAHDLKIGDAIIFTSLTAGTGVTANVIYYVTSVGSTTTFNFSATQGGANVVPSVAYTAAQHTRLIHQFRLTTAGYPQPVTIPLPNPFRGIANNSVFLNNPSSLTSGNIYLKVVGYRGF